MCGPFQQGISLSYNPLALLDLCHAHFQGQMLQKFIFLVQFSEKRVPNVGFDPSFLERTSMTVISLLLVNHHNGGMSPDQTTSLPLLPFSIWLFLYSFNCGRAVLLAFRLSSERVTPYVVAALGCPWAEVSSEPSYSPILIGIMIYFFLPT